MSESVILQDDQPVDPDDELLVSFMDGELTQSDRKQVEKRLVDEQSFRERLQALQTGWEWLDELPSELPSEQLVASTIELVVTDIAPASSLDKHDSLPAQNGDRGSRKSFFVALLCGLGLVAGAGGVMAMREAALQKEIDDLAIIQHLDAYESGSNDFEFLRDLARNPRWQRMLQTQSGFGKLTSSDANAYQPDESKTQLETIESLSQNQRRQLQSELNKFRSFPTSRQRSIREFAMSVSRQSDHETLLKTMDAYAQWYDSLDDEQKDGVRSNDPEERQTAVELAIDDTMERLLRRSGTMISSENLEQLYFFGLNAIWEDRINREPSLTADINTVSMRFAMLRGIDLGRASQRLRLEAMLHIVDDRSFQQRYGFGNSGSFGNQPPKSPRQSSRQGQRQVPSGGRDGSRRGGGGFSALPDSPMRSVLSRLTPIDDAELESLTKYLDDEAISDLEQLTDLPHELDRQLAFGSIMRIWCTAAVRRQIDALERDDRSLIEKYLAENADTRDQLDLLPPDELKRQLEQPKRPPRPR